MPSFALILALVMTAAALAGTAYAAARAQQQPSLPNWPRSLVIVAAFCIALLSAIPPFYFYKGALCLAMLILIVADALMLVPGSPPTLRAGANIVIYFLMWLAFSITAGRALWTLPGLVGLIPLAVGALIYVYAFRPVLQETRLTVALYMANATLVTATAAALFAVKPALWSLVGLLGATLYVTADLLAAWHAWRRPFRMQPLWWTLCLLVGLLFLAWSNWSVLLDTIASHAMRYG